MTDSPRFPGGPPLFRPVPVRPFKVNLREALGGEESLPQTPQPSSVNLDWLNYKLSDGKGRLRSESASSISRAQSVLNLTSSTLMGIYAPTNLGNDRYTPGNGINTPWESGLETPAKLLAMDDSAHLQIKQRAYPARRSSGTHHQAPLAPKQATTTSIFYSSLRALLLSGLGVVYGMGVATVRESGSAATFRLEHLDALYYSWGYMAFWGAAGLALGCLLPWVDRSWMGFGESSFEDTMEKDGDAGCAKRRRDTDWALAVRCMGIFIGIAYALRKLEWDSTLQVSLSLALVNPALWYLIDGSIPGLVVSSVVGVAGSALLTSLHPDMVPVPAILSVSSPRALNATGAIHAAHYIDAWPVPLNGLVSEPTLAMGIWTLNVLFCCSVVFGNVGRWLAINKYGTTRA